LRWVPLGKYWRSTLSVMRQITRTNEHVEAEGIRRTGGPDAHSSCHVCASIELLRRRRDQEAERAQADAWGNGEWIDRDLVWPSARGTPLSPSNRRRLLRRPCEPAGIRQVPFHTLRHPAATLLLAQGLPSAVILDVLGHQDVRMLRRYQHVTDSLRQEAADAVDRSFAVTSTVEV
jgi:integrase